MHANAPIPNKEVELKLQLPARSLSKLRNSPLLRALKGAPTSTTEVSVYFDTDKRKLYRRKVMLRVRRIGDRYVQTIKAMTNAGPFERDEWQAEIGGDAPELSLAYGTALEPLMTHRLRQRLKPLFETRVRRTLYPIVDETRAIAMTVDRGTIDTGSRSRPLCEIELELKRGDRGELFRLARELAQAVPLELVVKSKSQRGYELIQGEWNLPIKAAAIDLPHTAGTREAFKIIGLACLDQIVGNKPAVVKGDAEGVHQMRVGLRRLRAAISLFRDLLRGPQTTAAKVELKWLAAELGPARELGVLVDRIAALTRRLPAHSDGMPSLREELVDKREAALTRAQNAVQSQRFRGLTLDIAAWLETGEWMAPRDDLVRERGGLPIAVSAADQLSRRWRKVRKNGKALGRLDPRRRHKLRIQTKKLRYAVEFFGGMFTSKQAVKRRERFLEALERLQDGLGDLNDIAVHEERIAAIGTRRRQSSAKRAFAAGVLTGREHARVETVMKAAMQAYTDLAETKPFWR
jgi:triphosphatase